MHEQLNVYNKDLRSVNFRINSTQRDMKVNQATLSHINSLENEHTVYRSLGKSFLLSSKTDVESRLEGEHANFIKNLRDLLDRREYLERRISSTTTNLKELTSS